MKRRLLVMLLVIALLCPLLPVSSNAYVLGTESETGPWKWAMQGDNTVTILGYTGSASNVTIPTKIEVESSLWYRVGFVHNWTFMENTSVKKITIPSGIDVGGFGACNVEEIVFEGESILAASVFSGCKKLKSVKLPKNLEVLPFDAFKNCVSLKTVTLPDSLTEIQDDAFSGCTSLEKLHIPESVTNLGVRPFAYCTNLTELTVVKGNGYLVMDSKGVLYKKYNGRTELIFGATLVGEYTVLDGVDGISQLAFAGAAKLKKLNFPDNKVSISLGAFDGCTALKELVFQDRVTASGVQRDFNGFTIYGPVEYKGYFQMDFPEATFVFYGKPTVTKQPENVKAKDGEKVTFHVETDVTDASYQWQVSTNGGETWKDTSEAGNKTDTLRLTVTEKKFDRLFRCVIKDNYSGEETVSEAALLEKKLVKANILKEPADSYTRLGEKAAVKVTAEGDGLTYQWYIKDVKNETFRKSSVTKAQYSTTMSSAVKDRQLYCVLTDEYGNTVQTKTVTLRMAASITEQPKSVAAPEGLVAKTKVKAAGDDLTYQWYIKNPDKSKFSKSSVTSATYSCKMSESTDGRQAYCVITDEYGTSVKTETVTLYMGNPAKITAQPKNAVAAEGKTAKATVKASGDGLTYQWYIKNPGKSKFGKSSVTSATYSCKMSESTDGREAYCVITDKYGTSVQTNTVTFRTGNPPQIVKQPVSVSGKNGETVQTTVEATGEDLTYQWYIKNAGKTKFSKSSVTSATYSVAVSEKSDGREAYCVITDKYGNSVQSETVTITMIKEEVHTHTLQTLEIQPTCTEAGKIQTVCAECGEVLETVENPEKPALDHDWEETSNTATCTADGTKTSECSRCLSFKTESAPATGHVSTHVETKQPTCTVNGWEKTICDKCGEQVGATDVLPAPGEHTHEAAVVADAAKAYREHWSSENYADYLGYTDIVCQRCAVCYEIDETSFAYKYSAEEVTAMMLEHVNALRAEAGLAALTAGADQVTLAGTRAQEIAVNFTQSSEHKENIAKATVMSDCVLNFYNAFLESADQKANLLAEDATTFGCAIYYQDGAVYCVQIFA